MVRGGSLAAFLTVAALGLVSAPVIGTVYARRPPPAHTGGFGEPTCARCHADSEINDRSGSLSLTGFPEAYKPGQSYRLVVSLRHDEMRRGGFQLAARFAEGEKAGEQAGALRAVGPRAELLDSAAPVHYATHTQGGTSLTGSGTAEWVVEWTAPASGGSPVALHLVGNATNGDDSEFGDWIYARSFLSRETR